MSRSKWKLDYFDRSIWEYVMFYRKRKPLTVNQMQYFEIWPTWSRRSLIVPEIVNHTFAIHTGNNLLECTIKKEHIGFRLGALVLTKQIGSYFHMHNKVQRQKKKKQILAKQKKMKKKEKVIVSKGKVVKKSRSVSVRSSSSSLRIKKK